MSDTNARTPATINDSNAVNAIIEDKLPSNDGKGEDLFSLPAAEALQLLSASIELLVRMTGDIPPTPPPKTPTNPQMSGLQVEKQQIVRLNSQSQLRLGYQTQATAQPATAETGASSDSGTDKLNAHNTNMSSQSMAQDTPPSSVALTTTDWGATPTEPQPIDGVQFKHNPVEPQPYIIVGEDSQPINIQHGAITRKFYSKKEPPISINQYLIRLHQFCPMSTAVYLATSLYIHRLAVEERTIPVTRRNAHRLVLAGLRVATKALEDLSYPHAKIAKVGGVSEVELARLEISFCFLAGFELVVGEELLQSHWEQLRGGKAQAMLKGMEVPTLKLGRRPKEMPPKSG
ncbi:hypothetical protein E4U19_001804 [Claviceps sp. Clav32 group G5]|nr:hypothetical protein E4U19_001804 [Claviceps sp. Clav32 group G5]